MILIAAPIIKKKTFVPEDRVIKNKIPNEIPIKSPINIIMSNDISEKEDYQQKIALLKEFIDDVEFLNDIHEIEKDFQDVDFEDSPSWNFTGLDKDSIILCFQIRTIDKSRLLKHLGKIEDETVKQSVTNALKFQLDLWGKFLGFVNIFERAGI